MPRYNPNPNNISSTIVTLDKDIYNFEIGEPKAYSQQKKDILAAGIQWPLTVISGEETGDRFAGKVVFFRGEMMEDDVESGFAGGTKRFIMAARGIEINSDNEEAFNVESSSEDWSFDPDANEVGEVYTSISGNGVRGGVDINKQGDKTYQRFNSWFPLTAE